MSWPELLPFFAQTGVFGVLAWVGYHLHKDAIEAHDKRAAAYEQVAGKEAARNDELQKQLIHIITTIKTSTAAGAP